MKNTYLFISENGSSIPIAQRLEMEGNIVHFYINNPEKRILGDGIISKLEWSGKLLHGGRCDQSMFQRMLKLLPDRVIFDSPIWGMGDAERRFRESGIQTLGGGEWSEMVGLDLSRGIKVLDALSLRGSKVPNSIPVTIESWFNKGLPILITYSFKNEPIFDNNMGVPVEGMGSTVIVGNDKSKLYTQCFIPLLPLLDKIEYSGPISMKVHVEQDHIFAESIHPHISPFILYPLLEAYGWKLSDFFSSLPSSIPKFKTDVGMGVNLLIPPYTIPGCTINMGSDHPISGISKHNMNHVWMREVVLRDTGYCTTHGDGMIMMVTARGDNYGDLRTQVHEAKRRIMRTIKNISIYGMLYRNDISDNVLEDHSRLRVWGWL